MSESKQLKISAIQFDISWEQKSRNREKLEKLIEDVPEDTDILVLPEMFTTGFSMQAQQFSELMSGETIKWMMALSKSLGAVLCGSLMIEEFGNYYNRLLWIKPEGSIAIYDKRHPFCLIKEGEHFKRGAQRGLFSYKDWKIMPSICYDLRFPVWLRNDMDYDILLNVANWPAVRSFSWKQFLTTRALENQAYVIGLNRVGKDIHGVDFTGDSRIVSYDGKSLVEAKAGETDIISATLSKTHLIKYREKYPFLADRDAFTLGGVL